MNKVELRFLWALKLSGLGTIWNAVPSSESLRRLAAHEVDYIVRDDVASKNARDRTTYAAGSTARKRARTVRDRPRVGRSARVIGNGRS
jgi:hypothetical protein